jgi:hypothetical protein
MLNLLFKGLQQWFQIYRSLRDVARKLIRDSMEHTVKDNLGRVEKRDEYNKTDWDESNQ